MFLWLCLTCSATPLPPASHLTALGVSVQITFNTFKHVCQHKKKGPCGPFVRQTLRLSVLYQHLGHYQPACGRRSPVIHPVLFSCPGLLAKSPCLRTWLVVRHRVLLHRFRHACLASSSEALTSYEPSLMNRSHLAGSTGPSCLAAQEFDSLHTRSGQSLLFMKRMELNHLPSVPKTDALPNELRRTYRDVLPQLLAMVLP